MKESGRDASASACRVHFFGALRWCTACVALNQGEFYDEAMDELTRKWYHQAVESLSVDGHQKALTAAYEQRELEWKTCMIECYAVLESLLLSYGCAPELMQFDEIADQLRAEVRLQMQYHGVVLADFKAWLTSDATPRSTKKVDTALEAAVVQFAEKQKSDLNFVD